MQRYRFATKINMPVKNYNIIATFSQLIEIYIH